MKKCFNNVQMFKSSEVCDKFSKSVSYETLVIGATTTGSECGEALEIEGVITRRTSVRRGYLPEQGIHANEESLFASVTWLMKLPRRIQRMLLVMTIPTLAFLLSLNLSTAFAGCSCDPDGNTLTISNCDYGKLSEPSCAYYKQTANNVIIGTGVTSIGGGAFMGASSLKSITIPDNIDTKNWDAAFAGLPANTKIVCQGNVNTCYEKLKKYIPESKGGTCTNFCINKEIQPALFDSCKSTNYFWDGSTCIREPDVTKRKCCTSCKDMGGWCNRIQYTPAEAAQVLRDDNTNEITITFKK